MDTFDQNNVPNDPMPMFRKAEMDIAPAADEQPVTETPAAEENVPPVQEMPTRPVFTPPAYTQPVYAQPSYTQPVYTYPAYRQPQAPGYYQQPVYRGDGVGRRETVFVNNGYGAGYQPAPRNVVPNPDAYRYQSQPAAPEKKPEKIAEKVPEKKKQKTEKKGGFWKVAVAAALVLAVIAGSCGITFAVVNKRWENKTAQMVTDFDRKLSDLRTKVDYAERSAAEAVDAAEAAIAAGSSPSGSPSAAPGSLTPAQVYAQNKNSVVLIYCEVLGGQRGQTVIGASTGSGFIVTETGYIVTNYHVVDDAGKITVTTANNTQYGAQYVGGDESNDFAVLKINDSEITDALPTVTLGDSDKLIVGDQVVAIGNPLGELTSTLTVGYISAKERDVSTSGVAINMLQTDAAINSGNSGGPLFNMKGEVIGITSAKYSGTSSSGATIEGIGFAIPIDDVEGMLMDLMEYGYITGAYLGVLVSDVNPDAVQQYGVPMGAYVSEVTPGNCAEKAGMMAKDIITDVGGFKVEGLTDLTRALRNFKGGDTVEVTVYRSGQSVKLTVTLDEKPQATEDEQMDAPNGQMPESGSYEEWYDYFYPFFGD